MNEKILVVEDEKSISDAIAYALRREGYRVEAVDRGDAAVAKAAEYRPDAVILDVLLPGMDGFDVLKRLPGRGSMGVIMLTAKGDIVDKVLGLELGADDYMTKPFEMRELLARLKSLLRRMQAVAEERDPERIDWHGARLHTGQRQAIVGGRRLDLTPKEFDLLALLAASPGRVYTREQLLDRVWGMDYAGGTRTVDIHVQRVRKKLGPELGELIQTMYGIGYKAAGG